MQNKIEQTIPAATRVAASLALNAPVIGFPLFVLSSNVKLLASIDWAEVRSCDS
jgi:hypothetical protein